MSSQLNKFTKLYPTSKTLRFSLVPDPRSQKFIEDHGFIEIDSKTAADYTAAKLLLDKRHRYQIDKTLESFSSSASEIDWKTLADALAEKKNSSADKAAEASIKLTILQDAIRTEIANDFKKDPDFTKLFKKEVITELMPKYLEETNATQEEKELISGFHKKTIYFLGFHENRKNIYTNEAIPTAIPFRIVNDNFLIYYNNIHLIKTSPEEILSEINNIDPRLLDLLKCSDINDIFKIENYGDYLRQSDIDKYNQLIGGVALESGEKLQGINERLNLAYQNGGLSKKYKLKPLKKQILSSEGNQLSFLQNQITCDFEATQEIIALWEQLQISSKTSTVDPSSSNMFKEIAASLEVNF